MVNIECGGATGRLKVGDDGVGVASFRGLVVPANFVALGLLTMRAGIERKACGLIYSVHQAAICCDPVSMTAGYPPMAPELRALPVAFVINGGQAELYRHVVRRAASAGLLRRAFFSEPEARAWLQGTIEALDANRGWWDARRRPPAPARRRRAARRAVPGPGAEL